MFVENHSSEDSRSSIGMLGEQGVAIGRFKVSRLMEELGLICKQPGQHTYEQATIERIDILNGLSIDRSRLMCRIRSAAALVVQALDGHGLRAARQTTEVVLCNDITGRDHINSMTSSHRLLQKKNLTRCLASVDHYTAM
jgi:arginine repressor